MTYHDDFPSSGEGEYLGGSSEAVAWSDATRAAPASQLPLDEPPPAAIPWQEPAKRPARISTATLVIGLGVFGAVILLVAIVWAMFTQQDSSTNGADPFAGSSRPRSTSTVASSDSAPGADIPVAVADPDGAGQRCADGFHVKGHDGFGTHSLRGSKETSCVFTGRVLEAYWEQVGAPTKDPKRVTAEGTVPCSATGGECRGEIFVMTCAAQDGEAWITCVGGKNARVFIY
jgi:serine/threonine-protein kinase